MFVRPGRSMTVFFVLFLAPLVTSGCEGVIEPPDTVGTGGEVTRVTIEPGSAILLVGQVVQLHVVTGSVGPSPSYGPVTWASTNPVVASVSSSGLVRAVSPGGAIITMSGPKGRGRSAIAVK